MAEVVFQESFQFHHFNIFSVSNDLQDLHYYNQLQYRLQNLNLIVVFQMTLLWPSLILALSKCGAYQEMRAK